jgi:hypothetical protein
VKRAFSSLVLAILVGGCAGYQLGPATPAHLRHVKTIAVPTFANTTLTPRIEALVTGTIIKQMQQDGTFRIVGEDQADAVLKGEIVGVNRSPARSVRGNVLATTEFNLSVVVRYSLVERGGKPLSSAGASGSTSFFRSSDVATDERQALPLAAEELAKQVVSQLSEGW